MNIEKLIQSCENKLEKNLVSSAIYELHDEVYKNDIHEIDSVRFMYAKLLGHLGEMSETLRTVDELRKDKNTQNKYKYRSAIYSAMCWSRLLEFEKAKIILKSIKPPRDPEYLVHYWSHLLSISFEQNDKNSIKKYLLDINALIDKKKIQGIPLQELLIWKTIFETYLKTPFTEKIISKTKDLALQIMLQSGKKSFTPYICLRIGNLFERLPNVKNALAFYREAKQSAFDGNHGIALLMSNLAIINVLKRGNEFERLIKETCVVAGQHGIGLIHCELSQRIWKLLDKLNDKNKSLCKQWLLTDRHLPDIGRLIGDDFERLCRGILESHGREIFKAEIIIEKLPQSTPFIDLIIKSSSQDNPLKIAVQCKGRNKDWTKNSLISELQKNGVTLNNKFLAIHEQGYTGYILMCSTQVDYEGKQWLDENHNAVFKNKSRVFDSEEIKKYLLENPKLRMIVSMVLNINKQ